ncbi:glycosyltransferase family 2 protein [Oryzomonas japonica]|uniref:Glycosyltransferase family 2 protein n=1 Tax=Oryzomonas japonica TaxID=2603858 RepID=A0A7J4ZT23_9BACT|nr:glycosyltransferase family 2 protein [Oryzomonas japonica]KAB0666506.1 glycosyltransferase family 2 protein [Oryzomonas japonica]
MIETFFFLSVVLVFYVYAGYPLLAAGLAACLHQTVRKKTFEPTVTILISAYNEAEGIATTIENKLGLEYPQNKLEIIVISDGSTDRTDVIVQSFADHDVRLLRQEPRAGKTSALNMAVPLAKGDIIIFSDANSLYAPDTLRKLLANFADEKVGYVTGKMIYANPDGTPIGEGCSAYMKYENALRSIETRLGSVVGVDGGIDAIRATLYRPMNADQLPDFVQPLKVIEQGCRVVYEPEAVLWEHTLKDTEDEYRMRVRVSLRAFWALFDMRQLLWPGINPLFAWQLWSHKVLRYLCFWFLLVAYVTNWLLLGNGEGYTVMLVLQHAGYVGALAAPRTKSAGVWGRLLTFSRYFVLLNLASAHAFGKFLLGKKQVVWTPRKG